MASKREAEEEEEVEEVKEEKKTRRKDEGSVLDKIRNWMT